MMEKANKVRKTNFRGSRVWVSMDSGLKLLIKDYDGKPIPFEPGDIIGKTIPEVFEFLKTVK